MYSPAALIRLINFLPASIGMFPVMGCPIDALAQAESTAPGVPSSAWYAGLGASYNSVDFGTQNVFAVGTSNVYRDGSLASTGSAAGPANIHMNSQSTFAPAVQGGYFQHFAGSNWLWGAKFSYAHLGTTSTIKIALLPQTGSFTDTGSTTPVPFTGNAVVRPFQTIIEHQMALMPFIGHSFEQSFVYLGAGPTLSETRTNVSNLVGFADINGKRTDVSGAPISFTDSGWIHGGAAVIGATYFFDPSWFLDLRYAYSMTRNHTSNFSGSFTNPDNPGSIITGTLVGSSSGKVITQGVAVTINKAF
jgi:hypothetical protein